MRKSQIVLAALLVLGAPSLAYLISIARGPDFDIEMVRPIPSKLSVDYLDQAIGFFPHWPAWFHSGAKLTQVDASGNPIPKAQQKLQTQDYLRLGIDTQRLRGKYDLTLLVTDYTPKKHLALRVIGDTKNSLTRLFDRLDWEITFEPKPDGTLIIGKASAHTHQWRARIFGKLVPSILLNQVFYPNIIVLADIKNPNVLFPDPADDPTHGGM
jgi:hypothetical protein